VLHRLAAAAGTAALALACRGPQHGPRVAPEPAGPYALLLGTAQDGGLFQIGCEAACCARARRDPGGVRLVASLLLVDPRSGTRFLFDATPDLPRQVELARGRPAGRPPGEARRPLFDGIFLSHAHMGHYAGLLALGREAYGSGGVLLHASARMGAFLRENAPWKALLEGGARLELLEPGRALCLGPELTVTPIAVPHREEYSDTLAFLIAGPRRTLLYAPDTDAWERWSPPIEELLARVDLALLDGTFFDDGEVPGRDLAEIPHPFVRASLERFSNLTVAERTKIHFVHLNHTNPAADPDSAASAAVRAAGLAVARECQLFEL
jgi:pyrroloquinoline quinone biosynthesis protein B